MASTNKTTNYELSQFQSSDIPAWLTDYNGDMQKIDAGIHAAKTQAQSAANGVAALQTAVSGKQDTLTFDSAPISGSSNPVTSGGIYNALQNVSVQTDAVPTAGSSKAVQSGGVYDALQGKQNTLTFDSMPIQGSQNPVTSNGVYEALAGAATGISVYDSSASSGGFLNNGKAIVLGKTVLIYAIGQRPHEGTSTLTFNIPNNGATLVDSGRWTSDFSSPIYGGQVLYNPAISRTDTTITFSIGAMSGNRLQNTPIIVSLS